MNYLNRRRRDARKDGRSSLLFSAILSSPAGLQTVRIRNISASGAMLSGTAFPPEGTSATLRRGDIQVAGTVAWRKDRLAGLTFDKDIDVEIWLQQRGRPEARRILGEGENRLVKHLRELQDETDRVTFVWVSNRLAEISEQLANSGPMRVELADALIEIDALASFLRDGTIPLPHAAPAKG